VPDYHSFSSTLGGNRGISVIPANPPSGWDPYKWQSVVFGIAVIVVLWVLANVSSSRIGRSFRAVRDDEIAASLAGLSVARTQVLAFVVSAACAGVGGALLALYNLDAGVAAFPLSLSLSLLAAAVFGGLGRLTGSVLGAVIVTLLPNWSQSLTNALSVHSAKIAPNLPLLIYGVVLAVAMLAVPDGLQGGLMRLRRLLLTRRR
jgi:branched-chain amino acid transport system permease protein